MQSVNELKNFFRKEGKKLGIYMGFSRDDLSATTSQMSEGYNSIVVKSQNSLYLRGASFKGGMVTHQVLSMHLHYWIKYAKLNHIPMIQIHSKSSFVIQRVVTENFVNGLGFNLFVHHDKELSNTFYTVYDMDTNVQSILDNGQRTTEFWKQFLIQNNTALLTVSDKLYQLPRKYSLRWHGVDTEILCEYNEHTLDISITNTDLTFHSWEEVTAFIEQKNRLSNLLHPQYIHFNEFLKSIESWGLTRKNLLPLLVTHLQSKGLTYDKIERISVQELKKHTPTNRYLKNEARRFKDVYSLISSPFYAFTFGTLYIHISKPKLLEEAPYDILSDPSPHVLKQQVHRLFSTYMQNQFNTYAYEDIFK